MIDEALGSMLDMSSKLHSTTSLVRSVENDRDNLDTANFMLSLTKLEALDKPDSTSKTSFSEASSATLVLTTFSSIPSETGVVPIPIHDICLLKNFTASLAFRMYRPLWAKRSTLGSSSSFSSISSLIDSVLGLIFLTFLLRKTTAGSSLIGRPKGQECSSIGVPFKTWPELCSVFLTKAKVKSSPALMLRTL